MLPPPTQDRIFNAVPSVFPLQHEHSQTGETIQYDWQADKSWYKEDVDIEGDQKPEIIIQPTLEGRLRSNDQPIGDLITTLPDDDPAVAYRKIEGKRLYDEWTFTIADNGSVPVQDSDGNDAGVVAAGDRVQWCNFAVKNYFWYETDDDDLYEYGDSGYEIPVRFRILTGGGDNSSMTDQINQSRRVFTLRMLYTLTYETAVDAVDKIRGDIDRGGSFSADV